MRRTDEQKAADEKLANVIEETLRAYGLLEPGDMTQEYVVLVATQKWDPEQERATSSYNIVLRDGAVASTRIVGLLEMASYDLKSGPNHA